jgi:preprotein translocase subunit SecE
VGPALIEERQKEFYVAKVDKNVVKVEKKTAKVEKKAARVEKAPVKVEKKVPQKAPNRIQRYFRETIGELRKVSWPSRQEALNLTIVVLIVIISMSTFLGVLDFIYARFFALILGA